MTTTATSWVALLRGVNVGGITIRNADLADMMAGIGARAVRTVRASGNVRFEMDAAASARSTLKASIELALRERFDYDAWIVLVTIDELRDAVDCFPFNDADPLRQPWVIFGSDQAVLDELREAAASLDPAVDPVESSSDVIYWNPAKGSTTDTPFAKMIARKVYRSTTTNRNLRTLRKILD